MERENGELKSEVEELKKKLVSLEIKNGGKADSLEDDMCSGKAWPHLAQLLQGQMYVRGEGMYMYSYTMLGMGSWVNNNLRAVRGKGVQPFSLLWLDKNVMFVVRYLNGLFGDRKTLY